MSFMVASGNDSKETVTVWAAQLRSCTLLLLQQQQGAFGRPDRVVKPTNGKKNTSIRE
jgi:hypothetical protein